MRILATAGGTVCKDMRKKSRDLTAGKQQISFRLLRVVIYPLLLVKQHKTQVKQTSVCVGLQGGSKAASRHLPLSEIDEPLGLARGGQVSPVPVEKKLPLLVFGESATQFASSSTAVVSVCQAAEYSCDHKPLTYEESSPRGSVAPSPLYTRQNIANTSE